MKYVLMFLGLATLAFCVLLEALATAGLFNMLTNGAALHGSVGHLISFILTTLWVFCLVLLANLLMSLGRQLELVWKGQ